MKKVKVTTQLLITKADLLFYLPLSIFFKLAKP